jgi:hypothetical protein
VQVVEFSNELFPGRFRYFHYFTPPGKAHLIFK